jgi:peptide/nickel transport system substrate-binding protein
MLKSLKITSIIVISLVLCLVPFQVFSYNNDSNSTESYALRIAQEEEHEFRFGYTPSINHNGIDPANSFYGEIFFQCLETLFAYNLTKPGAQIIARLAEGYKWHNSTSLEVRLRPNVKFHDGTPFNASAVKWNIERLYNIFEIDNTLEYLYKVDPTPFRSLVDLSGVPEGELVNIVDKCVVLDELTVRFDLNVPYSPFIYLLATTPTSMLSPTAHAADKEQIIDAATGKLVGTGPFKFISYESVDESIEDPPIRTTVTFWKNNNYWRDPDAYITNLTLYCYNWDINNALLDGEVDYIDVPTPERYEELSNSESIDLIEGSLAVANYFLVLSCQYFDLPVRTAVARAFNYTKYDENILNGLLGGYAERSRGPIPKGLKYYNESIPTPGDDPEEDLIIAKNALIDSDYEMRGLSIGSTPEQWVTVAESDEPIATLSFTYFDNAQGNELWSILSESCKSVGIKVEKDVYYDFNAYYTKIRDNYDELQSFYVGWAADYPDPSNFIIPLFSRQSPYNFALYDDDLTETWMYRAVTEIDEDIIQESYNNISTRLQTETYPLIFLHQNINVNAISHSWTGIETGAFNRFYPYFYPVHEKGSGWIPQKQTYAYILLDADENTPIAYDPISDISLEFTNLNTPGDVVVKISEETPQTPAGFNIAGTYYDIDTTVGFTGNVIIGMPYYDLGDDDEEEKSIVIMHYDENSQKWKPLQRVSIDTTNNIIYCRTTSFSIFAVMIFDYIPAIIDFDPDVFNLKSERSFVTAYIEFPEDLSFDVTEIDINSIYLSIILAEDHPTKIGDHDCDGISDLMVKFNIDPVKNHLNPTKDFEIIITGMLFDGTRFEGIDLIDLI